MLLASHSHHGVLGRHDGGCAAHASADAGVALQVLDPARSNRFIGCQSNRGRWVVNWVRVRGDSS
jgi:hypothetical protein